MKRSSFLALSLLVAGSALVGCAKPSTGFSTASGMGWVTLLDDSGIDRHWDRIGDANWRMVDGVAQADKGSGFLVTRNSYADFQIRAEFWVDADANSGIFMRLSDPKTVNATNSYEVNIYDKRPEPSYGTGAIVDFSKVDPMPKAGGQWNVYEITAKGTQLTVKLNGVQTANVQASKYASGPIALQYAPGVVKDAGIVKFRKVQIRAL
jgi:Domain of Unknown Function (DUF1080)